jgi:hypothetical protein
MDLPTQVTDRDANPYSGEAVRDIAFTNTPSTNSAAP